MRGFFSVRIKQYDWEFALWQMAYLVADPRRVFRTVFYHHQTKARLCPSLLFPSRREDGGGAFGFCFFLFLLLRFRRSGCSLSDAMHLGFLL